MLQSYFTSTIPFTSVNFGETTLGASLSNTATNMTVATGSGKEFFADQTVGGANSPMLVLICNSRTLTDMRAGEIVKITDFYGGSEDQYTIERDPSNKQNWSSGTLVLANSFVENVQVNTDLFTLFAEFITFAFGSLASGVIRTTLNPTTDLRVQAGSGMNVTVDPGRAFVERYPVKISTQQTVGPFSTSGIASGESRIDLVTLEQDGTLSMTQGTAASSPSAPPTPASELLLAEVTVSYGDTQLVAGDINDERLYY